MVCSTCIHVSVLVVNFAWFKILHALTPATHSYALLPVVIQKHTLELVGMGLYSGVGGNGVILWSWWEWGYNTLELVGIGLYSGAGGNGVILWSWWEWGYVYLSQAQTRQLDDLIPSD